MLRLINLVPHEISQACAIIEALVRYKMSGRLIVNVVTSRSNTVDSFLHYGLTYWNFFMEN